MNLREETRVAEQAKAAVTPEAHVKEAQRLSQVQDQLDDRIQKVIKTIEGLPKPQENFSKELMLLAEVDDVMQEATEILAAPERETAPSQPRPKRLSCCCKVNGSIQNRVAAVDRPRVAVVVVKRKTRHSL